MFQRIKLTLLTGLGSSSARGQLDVLDVTQRVKNDWAEYRGMMNVPLTFGQVTDFLRYKYDLSIDLSGQFGVIKPGARMSKEQFQRFATEIARLLIRGGAVTFARNVPKEIDESQFDAIPPDEIDPRYVRQTEEDKWYEK